MLSGSPRLYAYGRQALTAGLSGLPPGDVMCPAYVCDTAVDGIRAAGRRPRYFRVDSRLRTDWESMPESIGCAAFLLVHYFGFRSDLDSAAKFCADRGLVLIEDCAHAFLSRVAGLDVGTRGQLAVYSWRKFLPITRGGALVENGHMSGANGPSPIKCGRPASGWMEALRQAGKWGLFRSGSRGALTVLGGLLSDERPPLTSTSANPEPPDAFASNVLAAESSRLQLTAAVHRRNYRELSQRLRSSLRTGSRVRFLFDDPVDDTAPWCLPLLLPDMTSRDRLVERLLRRGIGAWTWPDLPQDVTPETWPSATDLAGRTLCLPVHRDVDDRRLDYVAQTIAG